MTQESSTAPSQLLNIKELGLNMSVGTNKQYLSHSMTETVLYSQPGYKPR